MSWTFFERYKFAILFTYLNVGMIFLLFSSQYLLFSDELFFNSLSESTPYEHIVNIIESSRNSLIPYFVVLLVNLAKVIIVASTISLGLYLILNKWIFSKILIVVVKAEFVQLVPIMLKILWFTFIQTDYTLYDLQLFYPFSLLNLLEPNSLIPYFIYPLQVLNLFEVAYWFALAYGVAQMLESSLERGFKLVMASYGSGLVLWVVFVMFLTVSLA